MTNVRSGAIPTRFDFDVGDVAALVLAALAATVLALVARKRKRESGVA
jgi:hypothetical protein